MTEITIMKPLDTKDIYGNWATLLLPINSDDSIDFGALAEIIDILIASESNGIYSNGTAGEFYNQTEQEFDRICEMFAEKCNDCSMNFQIGVSHMSPIISRQRLLRSKQFSPGAFQIILPDWLPTTLEESIDFLKEMQELADPIKLVLYNPPHAKYRLSPQEIAILNEKVKNLIGVKVLDGPENWYQQMAENFSKMSVFVPGHNLATGVLRGAHGSYSNMACLNPFAAQKWYDLMQTDMDIALEIESRIQVFISKYISPLKKQGFSNPALDKFLAALGGWGPITPRLRKPYRGVDISVVKKMRESVWEILPEFKPMQ